MSDCPNAGKTIGGCKFEARYDRGPADLSQFRTLDATGESGVAMLEAMRPVIYVHDICVRCGRVVGRNASSPLLRLDPETGELNAVVMGP